MLVSAKVSAVRIVIAEEIRSVVEMAAVVSVVHLFSKVNPSNEKQLTIIPRARMGQKY